MTPGLRWGQTDPAVAWFSPLWPECHKCGVTVTRCPGPPPALSLMLLDNL